MSTENTDYSDSKSWLDCFGWQIPVAIILVIFLVTNSIQLTTLIGQSKNLSQNNKQLLLPQVQKSLNEAFVVSQRLNDLVHELVLLAPTNKNAQQILDQFQIPYNK